MAGRALKLTPVEVDEIWSRWRSGQAVKVLSREMRVNPSTVRDLLHRTGGIRAEQLAPGAKANDAQGKIIVGVLHQDLISPKAAAALLRYSANCPGLHTLAVQPVAAEKVIGLTCASMTHGSYGLVFAAASHAFVGFVVVTPDGRQNGPAEIVGKTGIVPAIGQTP